MPGSADSLSYDRYNYVRNNPMRFADPSGNRPVEEYHDGKVYYDKYWRRESVKLHPTLGPVAKEIKRLYAEVAETPGYWNANGQSFTPDDLVGLMMVWERSSYRDTEPILVEAAARKIWSSPPSDSGSPSPYCTDDRLCVNGIYNFLAEYGGNHIIDRLKCMIASGDNCHPVFNITNPREPKPIYEDQAFIINLAREWGRKIITNPDPAYKKFDGSRPWSWGNKGMYLADIIFKANPIMGTESNQVFFIKDTWLATTYDQNVCWEKGICVVYDK